MSVHYMKSRACWFTKWYEQGKEKRRYFKTESEARAFDAERREAQEEDSRLTLGELVAKFFQARPDYNAQTKAKIVRFFQYGAGAFLRDKYAESLNRQDLTRMREALLAREQDRPATNATLNKYQAYIRAILAWGVDQELIALNPWRDFKKLKVVKPVYQPKLEDLQRLYKELPEYLQWAVKTAFFLALRPGQVELFGLLWTAFNWRRGLVTVRQGKSGRLKTVVPPEYYLAEARARYEADMAAGIPLVCHRSGHRVLSFKTAWKSACRRAEVNLRPYDIRHIHATEALARGADLATVAAQLGHSSVATTGATYAHITEGSQARAAALMPSFGSDTDSDTIVIQNQAKK